MTEILSIWRIDEDGWIISPAGTKVARLEGDAILLYDKKMKVNLPLRRTDWLILASQHDAQASKNPSSVQSDPPAGRA